MGRVTQVTHADTTKQKWTYNGRATQFTDENGVTRISQVDGLGRPTTVCEISNGSGLVGNSGNPVSCGTDISGNGYVTTYAYSDTGSVPTTTVTQGAQTRTFQTDWLGRTTKVIEPESGTTTYTYSYTSTGLQVARVKPKANQTGSQTTTTTTQYDSIGRVVSISHGDGTTPNRSFAYDANPGWSVSPVNLKGRLALASSGLGPTATGNLFSYDPMGRVAEIWSCGPSTCGTSSQTGRTVTYQYDWEGNIISENDPAMGAIAYTRSLANEVTKIVNQSYSLTGGAGPVTLVSSVSNGPFGPTSWKLANGLTGVSEYDSLGRIEGGWVCQGSSQPNCAGGTSQIYGYTGAWSGTRLTAGCDPVPNDCINYAYDSFNRLTSRTVYQGTAQNYTYAYDRWGNRWNQTLTAGSGPQTNLTFNTANNQVTGSGYTYDAAGNMTSDSFHTYTYDAEGDVSAVDGGSTASYVYDAFNRKARTTTSSGFVEPVYDASNRVTSNWISASFADEGHIFWDGSQLALRSANGDTYFVHTDVLMSDRVHSNPAGAGVDTFSTLPFGDGAQLTNNDNYGSYDFSRFADLDDNSESGTYRAQFRQYSQTQGRWLSPDPYQASYDFSNPQSLNRYAYVFSSPLSFIDPTGLCDFSPSGSWITGSGNNTGIDFNYDSSPCASGATDGSGGDPLIYKGGQHGGDPGGGSGNNPNNAPQQPLTPQQLRVEQKKSFCAVLAYGTLTFGATAVTAGTTSLLLGATVVGAPLAVPVGIVGGVSGLLAVGTGFGMWVAHC